MKKKTTKLEQLLILSDEILQDLENEDVSLQKSISKCKKLARMRDDFEAIKWFTLELHGYDKKDVPAGMKKEELYEFAKLSGRTTLEKDPATQKEEHKYWIASIAELESGIRAHLIALENLKPPAQFTPAITKHSYESMYTGKTHNENVVEKYQDVLTAFRVQSNGLTSAIKHNKVLLSKIRNNVYNYVLNINVQLRFENITESIFQKTKETVDKSLSKICPEAIKKFVAAYERLKSDNPEEWSQALSSCRNVLKDFADYVFPAQSTPIQLSSGETLTVTDDKYKNRLIAFIDKGCRGNKRKLLLSRMADLVNRIHSLNDILSQGTHEGLRLIDVNICVIDTYLLIGSLLSATNIFTEESK